MLIGLTVQMPALIGTHSYGTVGVNLSQVPGMPSDKDGTVCSDRLPFLSS